jgi:hypothetical protein
MNIHLRDIVIDHESLDKIAGTVPKTANWIAKHPRGMTVDNIIDIYKASF